MKRPNRSRASTCRCGAPILLALAPGGQIPIDPEPLNPLIALDPAAALIEDNPTWGWYETPLRHRGYQIHPVHTCAGSTRESESTT